VFAEEQEVARDFAFAREELLQHGLGVGAAEALAEGVDIGGEVGVLGQLAGADDALELFKKPLDAVGREDSGPVGRRLL
jgi:hypothetical protein